MQLKIQPSQVKQRCRIPANDGTTDRGMALDHIDLGQGHQFQYISMFFSILASVCTEVSVPSMTKGKRTPSIQQQMQTIIAEDGLCNHPKGSYVFL